MPELPEAETVARDLAAALPGRRFESVQVNRPRSALSDPAALEDALQGRLVESVNRRGKAVVFALSGEGRLAFHMKMSGRLHLPEADEAPIKHTHLVFGFSGRESGGVIEPPRGLWFIDPRTFGWCFAGTPAELDALTYFRNLGADPLDLSPAAFAAQYANRRGRIKALLLNQSIIAGVGNIYADESLFRARIRPDAQAQDIPPAKLARLGKAVREVLLESIACCGSTISDYRNAKGDVGAFQNRFAVYGRAGRPCPRCGKPLESTRIAGRSTVFCASCAGQPEKP